MLFLPFSVPTTGQVALDKQAFGQATEEGFHVVLNEGSIDLKDDIWKMRWLIWGVCPFTTRGGRLCSSLLTALYSLLTTPSLH